MPTEGGTTVMGATKERVIEIPAYVPDDHCFVCFTAASFADLSELVRQWPPSALEFAEASRA